MKYVIIILLLAGCSERGAVVQAPGCVLWCKTVYAPVDATVNPPAKKPTNEKGN